MQEVQERCRRAGRQAGAQLRVRATVTKPSVIATTSSQNYPVAPINFETIRLEEAWRGNYDEADIAAKLEVATQEALEAAIRDVVVGPITPWAGLLHSYERRLDLAENAGVDGNVDVFPVPNAPPAILGPAPDPIKDISGRRCF